MVGYRRFLEETPKTAMTPEAIRRLADLQLEKQFGLRAGDGKPRELAAPEPASRPAKTTSPAATAATAGTAESEQDFERRTTAQGEIVADAVRADGDPTGPLEAIALSARRLTEYPSYAQSDQVLYQKARAYDELGRVSSRTDDRDGCSGLCGGDRAWFGQNDSAD